MFHVSQAGFYRHALLSTPVEFADVPNADFAQAVRGIKQNGINHPYHKPEHAAIIFYTLNHLAAMILKSKESDYSLVDKEEAVILSRYHQVSGDMATAMAAYVYLIISREIRHTYAKGDAMKKVEGTVSDAGKAFTEWLVNIPDGSNAAADYSVDNPCKLPLGVQVHFITHTFFKCSYSTGYGGPAWGHVAENMLKWITGHISTETFLDTSFTLAHNNGPIFNKGMIFDTYESKSSLVKVLDIQRAGKMLELICGKEKYGLPIPYTFLNNESAIMVAKKRGMLPEEGKDGWNGMIDWYAVKQAGALGNYPELYHAHAPAPGAPLATGETITVYPGIELEKTERE